MIPSEIKLYYAIDQIFKLRHIYMRLSLYFKQALFLGGIAQLVEQTAHIRSVIGPSPIAANTNGKK
jgi:hypothetical protein